MTQDQQSQTVQSVSRAVAILRSFTEAEPERRVTELASQLNLHKSTVSRILSTLQQEGLVSQDPETRKFRLGLGLISLAGVALGQMDVRGVAQPFLSDLVEKSQETVNVTVLEGYECVNVERARSPQPIRYVGWIGRRTPLHCTAAGKVLLAYLPEEDRANYRFMPLVAYTDKTIIDWPVLEESLADIRAQGYAIVHEEYEEGFSAVASPVCNHVGRVVAAVSISGPTYRFGPGRVEEFIDPLRETTDRISAGMGYQSI